jgi:hypothetical protein
MLDRRRVEDYVNREIVYFHQRRLARLTGINLGEVLRKKNPYLFKAKNVTTAGQLVTEVLDAFLSSSEEKLFGDFLEGLAVFVAHETCGGRKSTAQGIDLEFDRDGSRYLVSVKSGPNWGNSSQVRKLKDDFLRARRVQSQAHTPLHIQPVLGICYGRTATADNGLYLKIVGQSFWYFLSGDPRLYIELIEPIGHEAHRHNADFRMKKDSLVNVFTAEFVREFCQPDGAIDWPRLVQFNSGNMVQGGRQSAV